jgi:hypothetical protein
VFLLELAVGAADIGVVPHHNGIVDEEVAKETDEGKLHDEPSVLLAVRPKVL